MKLIYLIFTEIKFLNKGEAIWRQTYINYYILRYSTCAKYMKLNAYKTWNIKRVYDKRMNNLLNYVVYSRLDKYDRYMVG